MNFDQHVPKQAYLGSFTCVVQSVANGFLLTVNGVVFVIQGDGQPERDLELLQSAIADAYLTQARGQ